MNPDFGIQGKTQQRNQSVHPQKIKKKQSMATKAKDSRTVTKVHNTLSTMEKSNHLKLCKLQPLVRYDKLKSGHLKTDVGRENSKSGHRKTDEYHMGHICLCSAAKSPRGNSSSLTMKLDLRQVFGGIFSILFCLF
ncbi:hypothetical protein QQP08_014471 [Theobroma cacao]|nr:hypothetical protein QQP08_014471 [Theobroma cacao]